VKEGRGMPSRQQYPVDIIFEGGMGEDLGAWERTWVI